MHWLRKSFLPILVVSVSLILNVANAQSQNRRANQHEGEAAPQPKSIQEQKPEVPFAVWQSSDAALRESIGANKEQAIASQKQTDANKQTFCSPAVVVNEILALIGTGYLIFMGLQWAKVKEQARIANETLILAHRPRIKVRTFVIKPRNQFVWELPIDVECQVVNSGGSEAHIVESNCTVYTIGGAKEELPMLPPYSNQTDSFKVRDNILPAGLACPLYQPSEIMLRSAHDELVAKGEIKLYAIGYILYRDKLNNFYRTAFCRRFNFEKKRFEIVPNRDYEHQD